MGRAFGLAQKKNSGPWWRDPTDEESRILALAEIDDELRNLEATYAARLAVWEAERVLARHLRDGGAAARAAASVAAGGAGSAGAATVAAGAAATGAA